MRCYRTQPHASSHVYRSVLLCTKARRGSASSTSGSASSVSGGNHPSTTPSPSPSEEDEEAAAAPVAKTKNSDKKKKVETNGEKAPPVRSSSTLPFTSTVVVSTHSDWISWDVVQLRVRRPRRFDSILQHRLRPPPSSFRSEILKQEPIGNCRKHLIFERKTNVFIFRRLYHCHLCLYNVP